jgi:hypothetical protein
MKSLDVKPVAVVQFFMQWICLPKQSENGKGSKNINLSRILVWPLLLVQVLPRPQLIFRSNLAFWNLFEYSVGEII